VVVTSVTRDDLEDGGAAHFAATIRAIRAVSDAAVEVLVSDFGGRRESVAEVVAAGPDVFNHNVETVPRLYREVRPEADYSRSLDVLRWAGELSPGIATKSGLILGLGETLDEVREVFGDLRAAGVRMVTAGQYLQPSREHLPVRRFVPPGEFEALRECALAMGFDAAFSAPFVRSSYHAAEVFAAGRNKRGGRKA
jgi:lipoic acid synthetase